MARINFPQDGISIDVEDGSRVRDAIDETGADIPFGCREGNCATCMIEVTEGRENMNDPNDKERITLLEEELEEGIRLGCQAIIVKGEISVKQADAGL